jgi:hypothetical protein
MIAIEEHNHRAMIWALETSAGVPLGGNAAVAPLPTTVVDPTATNTSLTVAPQQTAVVNAPTAIMDPTTNPTAVSQLTAAILNPPTADDAALRLAAANPQTAIVMALMAIIDPMTNLTAVSQLTAVTLNLPTADDVALMPNPIVGLRPLMSSADGQSLSFAHSSTDASESLDFLNPSFLLSPTQTQAQVGQVIPELSHLYSWQCNDNINGPVLPHPNSVHSITQQWGYMAVPALTTGNIYQSNNFSHPSMLANVFGCSGSLMSTGKQPSHTSAQVSNTTPTGDHSATATLVSPFVTARLANGAAMQPVQGPTASLMNALNGQTLGAATQPVQGPTVSLMNASNGQTLNLVLNMAKDNAPAVVDGNKTTKKHKSHEEESAQLILPDGSHRHHRPRQMDENFIPTVAIQKGRATKKVKTKE